LPIKWPPSSEFNINNSNSDLVDIVDLVCLSNVNRPHGRIKYHRLNLQNSIDLNMTGVFELFTYLLIIYI
jgi:hypothetical protein